MKLRAEIVKSDIPNGIHGWPKYFHVRLAKGLRYFGNENIITRHIGPRPWSEMFFMDDNEHIHLVYSK